MLFLDAILQMLRVDSELTGRTDRSADHTGNGLSLGPEACGHRADQASLVVAGLLLPTFLRQDRSLLVESFHRQILPRPSFVFGLVDCFEAHLVGLVSSRLPRLRFERRLPP